VIIALSLLLYGVFSAQVIPYSTGFENGASDWSSNGWNLGKPNKQQTTECRSGSCYGTTLNEPYGKTTGTFTLTTPEFDFGNITYAELSFFTRYSFAPYVEGTPTDGVYVQWIAGGQSDFLGFRNIRLQNNWYDAEFTINDALNNFPVFGGQSKDWNITNRYTRASIILPSAVYRQRSVQFQFVFAAQQGGGFGFFLDDFAIQVPPTNLPPPKCPINIAQNGFTFSWQRDPSEDFRYPLEWRVFIGDTPDLQWYYSVSPEKNSKSAFLPPDASLYYQIVPVGYYGVYTECEVRTGSSRGKASLPYLPDLTAAPDLEMIPLLYVNDINSWKIGDPVAKFGSAAPGGAPALLTGISGNYTTGEFSGVFTPYLTIPSTGFGVILSFDIIFDSEELFDGLQIVFTSDGGDTLEVLGAYGDYNWYNSPNIPVFGNVLTSNADGWSGSTSGTWLHKVHALPSDIIGSSVMFGFVFGSDYSVLGKGVGLANIRVELADSSVVPNCPIYSTTDATVTYPALFSWQRGDQPRDDLPYGYGFHLGKSSNFGNHRGIVVPRTEYVPFLEPSQTYFWKVDALGAGNTSSQNCPVFSFTTPLAKLENLPYSTDFQVETGDWTAGGTNLGWRWSGGIWTNQNIASGQYNANAASYVLSPYFDMRTFPENSVPVVSFDLTFNTELKYDGVTFQYNYEGLGRWTNVGSVGANWYNYGSIDALFTIDATQATGWSGTGSGRMRALIPGLSGHIVRFRLFFASDNLGQGSGVQFTNFKLEANTTVVSNPKNEKSKFNLETLDTNIPADNEQSLNASNRLVAFLSLFLVFALY
jgi:hypothetical protein